MKNFEARTPFFGVVAEDLMDLVNVAIKKDRCILHFSSGVDDKADSSLVVLRTLSLPVNSVVLIGPVCRFSLENLGWLHGGNQVG